MRPLLSFNGSGNRISAPMPTSNRPAARGQVDAKLHLPRVIAILYGSEEACQYIGLLYGAKPTPCITCGKCGSERMVSSICSTLMQEPLGTSNHRDTASTERSGPRDR